MGSSAPKLREYRTLAGPVQALIKRLDSRFIALARPAGDRHQVRAHLEEIKARYPDATHHCWAARLLEDGALVERTDDDREPLHSAGPPILGALRARELVNVLGVVVRYFGGTKLGIGGLIRAYAGATQAALEGASVVTRVPQARLRVSYPPELTGRVMRVLQRANVTIEGVDYDERPQAQAHLRLPWAQREALERLLRQAGAGRVEVADD